MNLRADAGDALDREVSELARRDPTFDQQVALCRRVESPQFADADETRVDAELFRLTIAEVLLFGPVIDA